MSTNIYLEVISAFSDCNELCEKGTERNLDYRASIPVTPYELIDLIKSAMPDGYNNFSHESLLPVVAVFGVNAKFWIAREGSPCLYVKPDPNKSVWFNKSGRGVEELGADECQLMPDGTIRLWWD